MSSSSQSNGFNAGVLYAVGNSQITGEAISNEIFDITHPIPVDGMRYESITDISSSNFHTLALDKEGQIWTWGRNTYGAIGRQEDPAIPEIISHVSIMYTKFIKVACGDSISMAISSKGLLHTWGTFITEEHEIIGYLPGQRMQTYPRIVHTLAKAKVRMIDIAAGASHCLALSDTGQVYSWGDGNMKQLGRPIANAEEGLLPERIIGLENITSIACGKYHSFAINQQGQVFAWGLNQFQQCGLVQNKGEEPAIFGPELIEEPTLVPFFNDGHKAVSISGGEDHSIALMNDNTLVGFGRCDSGQLGIMIYENYDIWGSIRSVETERVYIIGYPVQNLWRCGETITKVICGSNHTLVLTDEGVAYGFGDSSHCQLGVYGRETIHLPIPLTSLRNRKVIQATAGHEFSLFIVTG